LLREKGIEPEIIKYLDSPPDKATISRLVEHLGMEPRDLLRKREQEYKDLGLADKDLSDEAIIAAMAAHPRLIERPIVVGPNGTVMGRPTERVLEVI
jgi:arsenate reductase